MKWKAKKPEEWRRKFAFLPKKIDDTWVWLEWYERTGWIDMQFDFERFNRVIPPLQ